jgi:hypothetical protein
MYLLYMCLLCYLLTGIMPQNDINKKRADDQRYREKKKTDPEWLAKRAEAARRYRKQQKENTTPRECRKVRRDARDRKRKQRQRQKEGQTVYELIDLDSQRRESAIKRELNKKKLQKKELQQLITDLRRKYFKEKKRRQRLEKRVNKQCEDSSLDKIVTPILKSPKETQRVIHLHFSLMQALRKSPALVAQHIARNVQQKYFKAHLRTYAGVDPRTLRRPVIAKRSRNVLKPGVRRLVSHFYQQDCNSRITTGKKQFFRGKQIRYLNFTMKVLYLKFQTEHPGLLKATTFYGLRPKHVKIPCLQDRETCACQKCSNVQLLADALFLNGVLPSKDLSVLHRLLVCSMENYKCTKRQCLECKNRSCHDPLRITATPIRYFQWEKVKQDDKMFTKCIEVSYI